MQQKIWTVVFLAAILAIAGCSDDDSVSGVDVGAEDASGLSDAGSDGGPQESQDVDGGHTDASGVDLSGRWVKFTAASALTDTIVGGEEESTTYSLLRVEMEQDGNELSLHSEVCAVDIVAESDFAETILPDAFVDALEPTQRQGTFSQGVFELPRHYELRGVEFEDSEDPETEPLPDEADDPRVTDPDGDGNPGLTIFVDAGIVSGEIYVVQRGWDEFEGSLVDDDRIEGKLTWDDEQEILGASDSALLIAEPTSRPNPDEESSHFAMVRLAESESDDCESLIERSEADFSMDFR